MYKQIKFQTITVPANQAAATLQDFEMESHYEKLYDTYSPDHSHSFTASFDDGIEMDIKLCISEHDDDSEYNPLWTEAVLFKNGHEITHTDVEDYLFGFWSLEYDNILYVVHVITDLRSMIFNQIADYKLHFMDLEWFWQETISHDKRVIEISRHTWHKDTQTVLLPKQFKLSATITDIYNQEEILDKIQSLYTTFLQLWNDSNTIPKIDDMGNIIVSTQN